MLPCVVCAAWGNSVTHGSQGRSGGGGQMSAEERSNGRRQSTGEITVITSYFSFLPACRISYYIFNLFPLCRLQEDQTPLHIASRLGKTEIVQLLLQHMAHPDAATTNGYTPLHISAREGQVETASVLLEAGASHSLATKVG